MSHALQKRVQPCSIAGEELVAEGRDKLGALHGQRRHPLQLPGLARHGVQPRQALVVVARLHRLLRHVHLIQSQCLPSQRLPDLGLGELFRTCHGARKVRALHGQVEAGGGLLHKVQGNLWVAALLQVADDCLADKVGVLDHVEDLRALLLEEGLLEAELIRGNHGLPNNSCRVQVLQRRSLQPEKVHWSINRFQNPSISSTI